MTVMDYIEEIYKLDTRSGHIGAVERIARYSTFLKWKQPSFKN